ncbi:response regulator of citrate/malate metabolism [Naumannella cuiyingiana]|uniref:Transcriptional regulatory protein n=1 Tax=Naumannella cuiyingiana TaxID=1347891 RepID=A0A7Z0D8G3_9ACTN|nr:response regulator [Naumannella cuiyingiana]NYI70666.1 response regulator of citrate/malate metabolism [Naumannella cuiyingiana]
MIRVLIVEDDRRTAQAHGAYTDRVEGFEVAGIVHSAADAVRAIRANRGSDEIHLLLLDMNLPDRHGLELCRDLRAAGLGIDVIAVTAVRELETVRGAVSAGIVQYLIKPFTFAAFADKLRRYAAYRDRLGTADALTQADVDEAIAALRTSNAPGLAKGLSATTLSAVSALLGPEARSASEVAAQLGLSRVTARRYLEHLAESGEATRAPRYGTRGRPEHQYRRARPT